MRQWARLTVGLAVAYAVFQWSASALGSDRGQAGLLVCGLVVGVTLAIERVWFAPALGQAARAIGLGRPRLAGAAASGGICVLLLAVVPAFARATAAVITVEPGALRLLPGLLAQAGIAEETLFRGYLFGHLRRERSFWRAASLSMLPFVLVHLVLFLTMPWPIAAAALGLSVVLSFPLAHLFELGGGTIWAPALLHFVVQAVPKLVVASGDAQSLFPIVWMAASAAVPFGAMLISRPPARS
jgi:membrane protease YdiL (CAAX protease family)